MQSEDGHGRTGAAKDAECRDARSPQIPEARRKKRTQAGLLAYRAFRKGNAAHGWPCIFPPREWRTASSPKAIVGTEAPSGGTQLRGQRRLVRLPFSAPSKRGHLRHG